MKIFRLFPSLALFLTLALPFPAGAFPVSRVQSEISRALQAQRKPVAVFDLDETVLHSDARRIRSIEAAIARGQMLFTMKYPRETDILNATPAAKMHSILMSTANRYDTRAWLGRLGIQNEAFRLELENAMLPIYLSHEFMHLDRAYHGAQALLDAFYRAGGEVYFVSSRYRTQQYDSTVHRLVLSKLFRNSRQSHVILREDGESSLDFKVRAFEQIRRATQQFHQVLLVAENEPENLNAMMRTFPSALPVFVVGAVLNTSVTPAPNARLIRTKTYLPGSLDLR